MKTWKDIDKEVLQSIGKLKDGLNTIDQMVSMNPPDFVPVCGFEHVMTIPEFTFLGEQDQPDFGVITIWFYAGEKHVELRSLKKYIYQYRDTRISYERAVTLIYQHLMEVYEPYRLRIEIKFHPRGGISSQLVVDSDWGCLGGSDESWKFHKNQ
jgi:7-cyano-7-deazaguanine reductase